MKVKILPSFDSVLRGCGWFLTWYMEDWVILDIMDCHHMSFLTCVPNFGLLVWTQEPHVLEVLTWATLMVTDWRLWGWNHIWLQRSSRQTKIKLSGKFHDYPPLFSWDIEVCQICDKNATLRQTYKDTQLKFILKTPWVSTNHTQFSSPSGLPQMAT